MTTATPVPDTWVNSQLITADNLNTEMRDMMRFLSQTNQTRATITSAQSIPNSSRTNINWNSELEDVDGIITVPNTKFTFTRAGVIAVRCDGQWAASTGGNHRQLIGTYYPVAGGSADIAAVAEGGATQVITQQLSFIVPVAIGDAIAIGTFQASGGALNCQATVTLRWVGAVPDWVDVDVAPPAPNPGGSGGGNQTPTKHTSSYYATWSRTYDGDNTITWDDSAECYQGYYSGARGNTRSLVGFDYATIKSDLAGATNVTASLGFMCDWSGESAGLNMVIGGHNYTAKPSTWNDGNVSQNQQKFMAKRRGYTIGLHNSFATSFQTGAFKGIAFGPGPTTALTYYGYIKGATMAGKPRLDFVYYK